MSAIKVFVHLGYGFDAAKHRQRYEAGLAPDVVPYGFHHAESMGCVVNYSSDFPESKAGSLVRRAVARLLGFDWVHAFRNRRGILSSDVVWTMEERQYLAVAALSALHPSGRALRLIAQTVWLFDAWPRTSQMKRALLRRLLRRADRLTVHSQEYLSVIADIFPDSRPALLRFGVSLDSFPFREALRSTVHSPIRILSLGNDRSRDWPTLLEAFGNDERFEVIVVTQSVSREAVATYGNVKAQKHPTMNDFISLYKWADYVVIPMRPNLYSGITVALEATSMGVPVVCSATGGVPTYFDSNEVLYAPPGDAEALRHLVLACDEQRRSELVRRAQARFLREDYSSKGMARRYVEMSRGILSQSAS